MTFRAPPCIYSIKKLHFDSPWRVHSVCKIVTIHINYLTTLLFRVRLGNGQGMFSLRYTPDFYTELRLISVFKWLTSDNRTKILTDKNFVSIYIFTLKLSKRNEQFNTFIAPWMTGGRGTIRVFWWKTKLPTSQCWLHLATSCKPTSCITRLHSYWNSYKFFIAK